MASVVDLVIRGGLVVSPEAVVAASVAVGGTTFGISKTVVTPPQAAAALPVCQSSLWV